MEMLLNKFISNSSMEFTSSNNAKERDEVEILRAQIKEAFGNRRGIAVILNYYYRLIDLLMDLKEIEQAKVELQYCIDVTVDFLGENHISMFKLREKLALIHFYNNNMIEALKEVHNMYFMAYNLVEAHDDRFPLVKDCIYSINYVSFYIDFFYGVFSNSEMKNSLFKLYTNGTELSSQLTLTSLASQFPEWRRYEMAERFLYDKLKKEENVLAKLTLTSYKSDTKAEIRKQKDSIFEIIKRVAQLFESERRIKLAILQYEKALTKAISFYGKNSIQVGEVLSPLSSLCNLAEKYEQGLSYAKRACVLLNAIPDKLNKKNPEYEVKLAKALITIGEIHSNAAKNLPPDDIQPYIDAEKYISAGMNIVDKHYGRDNPVWILAAYSLASNYDLLCSCLQEQAMNDKVGQMGTENIKQEQQELDNIQIELSEENQKKLDEWREKANNLFELIREVIEMSPSKYLINIPLTKGSVEVEEIMGEDTRMFRQTTLNSFPPNPTTINELYLSSREIHLTGSVDSGIQHLQNAMRLFEQQYGNEYLFEREFASTELANLFNHSGNIDEAMSLLEASLQRVEKALGNESKLYQEVSHAYKNISSLKGLSKDEKEERFQKLLEKYDKEMDQAKHEVAKTNQQVSQTLKPSSSSGSSIITNNKSKKKKKK
ncbi:hypothetical protein NAEGRDRAFT_59311 [Naegleria gruberi]|uniref:Uncharacterized protein n=1 Tax=Naegleria gruberi TaxID=5762 RepID=D2VV96_NAEGR|nr:uncharacterized protein NAEGRDRAFT_59311 [Naegleria gruberi]EFC39272.1 hypothetical protein NAEGRDRAFT_59311 [Naegleria gruberi]|eukprot:XP_002672016.1 hypothetical protein NAEGRDRAFT_59311 [Naegleria gruberi strain NEG-M]